MAVLRIFLSVFILGLGAGVAAASDQNWRQDKGVYEVYGITFEKFLELHPFTLLLIYDNSEASKAALEFLPELHNWFSTNNTHIVVAKMRRNDGPRWAYEWNAKRLPYFRLCIGDGVSATTRAYPEIHTIHDWATRIYNTQIRISEVNSKEIKKRFHAEPNAFYLRYNPEKQDYFDLLSKFQMLDEDMKIYYATNAAYDVFDNHKPEDMVIGFKRSFEEPIKFLSSPDKLNLDNVQRFFNSYRVPASVDLTEDILNQIVTDRIRSAFFFGTNLASKVLEAFRYLAFEQKDNYLFVVVGNDKELEAELKGAFGIEEGVDDQIRIVEFNGRDFGVYQVEGSTLTEIAASFEQFSAKGLVEVQKRQQVIEDVAGEL